MAFVQIIEFRTSRIDEFDAALDDWLDKSEGWRAPTRSLRTKDRDQSNTYLQIVEFPSYEKAMENSTRPETTEFAARLAALCRRAAHVSQSGRPARGDDVMRIHPSADIAVEHYHQAAGSPITGRRTVRSRRQIPTGP